MVIKFGWALSLKFIFLKTFTSAAVDLHNALSLFSSVSNGDKGISLIATAFPFVPEFAL